MNYFEKSEFEFEPYLILFYFINVIRDIRKSTGGRPLLGFRYDVPPYGGLPLCFYLICVYKAG
jgi:hypothetical protein